MDYAAELRAKQESVADAFRRIGGLDVPVLPPYGMGVRPSGRNGITHRNAGLPQADCLRM